MLEIGKFQTRHLGSKLGLDAKHVISNEDLWISKLLNYSWQIFTEIFKFVEVYPESTFQRIFIEHFCFEMFKGF